MKLSPSHPAHLTYCLNVHPGEAWADNFAAIRDKARRVRDLVARPGPFGLGLRLGRSAADELDDAARLAELRRFLDDQGLYVFTINGFPYGRFHQTAVKENVYAPDWRAPERLAYTQKLGKILAALLPEHVQGSISTVPGSYKPWIRTREDQKAMARNLALACFTLFDLRHQTGRRIELALEPEPDCFIETTAEAVEFLTGPLRDCATRYLADDHRIDPAFASSIWDHLGVCLDTAHAAVQFEDPLPSLRLLRQARLHVSKVQISSALRLTPTPQALARLARFAEGVYLHQVKVRRGDGTIVACPDLPQALANPDNLPLAGGDCEWRVHFHVPLFFDRFEHLASTSDLLSGEFFREACQASRNLEIETYTFDVLPQELRRLDVTESIAQEYRWVLERMAD